VADKTPEPGQDHTRPVAPGESHQEAVPARSCGPEASAVKPALSPPGLVEPNPVTSRWRLRLGEIRYDLARKASAWVWALPLVMAAAAFIVVLITVPVSPKGKTDRLVDVFGILFASSIALSAVVFSWQRQAVMRFKIGLVILYCVLGIGVPVVGIVPVLPDHDYQHRWAAPLLLGLSVAGLVGIFTTLLAAWVTSPRKPSASG
jgi:hypothetical protein